MPTMTSIDLNDLFTIDSEGDYTLLEFKQPLNKVIIYDPGLYHTAICKSKLSRVDTRDGKLYYRGVPVEEKIGEDYLDVAGEILFGDDAEKKGRFKGAVYQYFYLIPEIKSLIDALPSSVHPMDMLSITMITLGGIESRYLQQREGFVEKAGFITAQVAISVSYYYTKISKKAWIEPDPQLPYAEKILSQMHAGENREKLKKLGRILNTILILHAEHGQNCSAATVRNIASARGNLYTGVACGMSAFNGKIHGGASQLVSEMYEELLTAHEEVESYIGNKIAKKELIMGFGQRTYNRIPDCWDPRVETMYRILTDPSFQFVEVEGYKRIALKLIECTHNHPIFKAKNLTPNPDLFNCIFYKLFGVPKEMNTTMLALGRIAGWLANYIEHAEERYPLTRPCDIAL